MVPEEAILISHHTEDRFDFVQQVTLKGYLERKPWADYYIVFSLQFQFF